MEHINEYKFWCQKILPLVYDDSLSYYEVLCKVVALLNQVIENVNEITDEFNNLSEDVTKQLNEFRDWIYGEGLQNTVITVLNKWIADGTLDEILQKLAIEHANITSNKLSYKETIPEDYTLPDLTSMSADSFYTLYENLVAEVPEFESLTYGSTDSGLLLKYYLWTCTQSTATNLYENISTGDRFYTNYLYSGNTLLIFTGLHGNEKQSIWTTYNVIKQILTSTNDSCKFVRNNYNILICPCVNPYGINNNTRLNQNGVDLNRNFSYNWDSYESTEKGESPFSEKESQFCRDILLQYNTKQNHNGCVILDLHDFKGDTDAYKDYNLWISCNNVDLKLSACNLMVYMLDYLKASMPQYIKSDRPILYTQIANSPTLENYSYHLGFKYTALHECRTMLDGVNQYSMLSNTNAYYIISNLIHEISTMLMANAQSTQIRSLSEIGCSTSNTLSDIISAMPRYAVLTVTVEAGTTLSNDMPTYNGNHFTGMLTIERTTGDTSVSRLMFNSINQDTTKLFVGSSSADGTFNGWIQIQYANAYNNIFFDMSTASLEDIVAKASTNQTGIVSIRTMSGDAVLADVPNNSTGLLTIIANLRGTNRAGLAFYSTTTKFYFMTFYNSAVSSSNWITVIE